MESSRKIKALENVIKKAAYYAGKPICDNCEHSSGDYPFCPLFNKKKCDFKLKENK